MTNVINYRANVDFANETRMEACYLKTAGERAALPADRLLPINLDIGAAISTALGARPKITAVSVQIVAALPEFKVEIVNELEDKALALGHAQALYGLATESPDDLAELAVEGASTRDRLRTDHDALEKHGVIKPGALKEVKGLNGYRNIAADLELVINAFRAVWPQIEGKCLVTKDDLDRAERLATRMVRLLGLREQAPTVVAEATDNRLRAYALFVHCYDQIRRAVTYARWDEDDVETIAPSLWTGHGGHKSSTDTTQEAKPAPAPAPAAAAPAPAAAATPAIPGGSPFVS